jgi:hypothetical protein
VSQWVRNGFDGRIFLVAATGGDPDHAETECSSADEGATQRRGAPKSLRLFCSMEVLLVEPAFTSRRCEGFPADCELNDRKG